MKVIPSAATLTAALALATATTLAGWGDLLKQGADQFLGGSPKSGTIEAGADALSESKIGAGLKEALAVGAARAIDYLGRPGGFLDEPKVRIPLPGSLDPIARGLRMAGQGELVDEFETTMNRAAEAAVPQTLEIVKQTIASMTLDDARRILDGGDDAATRYLREKAGPQLARAIRPIVARTTDQVGATAAYKQLVKQAGGSMLGGFLGGSSLDLDQYVTDKALDGLFLVLAEEEKKIRQNPAARTTELLKQVFGG